MQFNLSGLSLCSIKIQQIVHALNNIIQEFYSFVSYYNFHRHGQRNKNICVL